VLSRAGVDVMVRIRIPVNFRALIVRLRLWPLRSRINGSFGLALFGNASGFIQNVGGNRHLKKARTALRMRRNGGAYGHLRSDLGSTLTEKGFEITKEKADGPGLSALKLAFNEWCVENQSRVTQGRLEASSHRLGFPFFKKFWSVTNLLPQSALDVLTDYYGGGYRVLNVDIYRTFPIHNDPLLSGGGGYGSTLCWHQDGSSVDTLKVFVALSDISELDGPMEILSKNQSERLLRNLHHFDSRADGAPGVLDSCGGTKFIGSAGAIVIADTNRCLHRATSPTVRPRDMICFYFEGDPKHREIFSSPCRDINFGVLKAIGLSG